MRSSVVLPQPDGPTSAPTSPRASPSVSSVMTSRSPAAAASYALCLIETVSLLVTSPGPVASGLLTSSGLLMSSGSGAPTGDMSFKWLHQEGFDHQHDGDEGKGVGENLGDVEK